MNTATLYALPQKHLPRKKRSTISVFFIRRGGRVVDCGGLENRCACKRTGGSNPLPSAMYFWKPFFRRFLGTIKTLVFLRLTRLSPDLRIQKFGLFILKYGGLRVPHYIFLGKYECILVKTIQIFSFIVMTESCH